MQIDDGRVVTNFIYQALNDERYNYLWKANQTRSFSYIEDTLDGLLKV